MYAYWLLKKFDEYAYMITDYFQVGEKGEMD